MAKIISRRSVDCFEPPRISRRRFCAAAATTLGVGLAGSQTLGAARRAGRFQLNYILAASLYGKTPLAEVLPEVAKTGSEAIDVWSMPHANHREQMDEIGLERAAELFAKNDVRLGAVTRYDLGPYRIGEELPLVERLGGQLLVCGAAREPGETERERVARFVERMKPRSAAAGERGVTIGIENHGGTILNTPTAVRRFAEATASLPNLGIALAPYHLPQDPEEIARLIEDLGPQLVFFQAWQHGQGCQEKMPKHEELMQLPGRGPLDFAPLVAALRKIDYCGYTEIFMHPVPRGVPIHDTTAAVTAEIVSARDYLEGCLATLPA